MRRPSTRSAAIWLGALLALTILSTLIHRSAWLARPDDPAPRVILHANNVAHIMTVPGWVAVRFVGRGWRTGGWGYPLFANLTAWTFWLGSLWIGLQMRRLVLAWRSGTSTPRALPVSIKLPAPPAALGEPDSSRRQFLATAPLALAGLGLTGSLVRGTMVDPWSLQTMKYEVPIRDLPEGLSGLRIVQISDTHLGPRIPSAFIEETVDLAISLRPDVVMLTGDYIHAGVQHIDLAAEIFKPLLRLNIPVLGILGNHDWYGDGNRVYRTLARIGITMLDNDRRFLCARSRQLLRMPPESGLTIAGIGDLVEDVVDLEAAFSSVPRVFPCLLMSHNPDAAELPAFRPLRGEAPRVDIMISGHTHGGQVHIPFVGTPAIPSRYGQKYAGGLVQGPAFPVLISRGVGMSILPVRFGVPPEISEITLVRA